MGILNRFLIWLLGTITMCVLVIAIILTGILMIPVAVALPLCAFTMPKYCVNYTINTLKKWNRT